MKQAREALERLGVLDMQGVWIGAQGSVGSDTLEETRSPIDGSVLASTRTPRTGRTAPGSGAAAR